MGLLKKATIVLLLVAFTCGCVSPAVKREQIKNPKCEVTEKDSSSGVVVVEIACPGEPPVEKTYFIR